MTSHLNMIDLLDTELKWVETSNHPQLQSGTGGFKHGHRCFFVPCRPPSWNDILHTWFHASRRDWTRNPTCSWDAGPTVQRRMGEISTWCRGSITSPLNEINRIRCRIMDSKMYNIDSNMTCTLHFHLCKLIWRCLFKDESLVFAHDVIAWNLIQHLQHRCATASPRTHLKSPQSIHAKAGVNHLGVCRSCMWLDVHWFFGWYFFST